MSTNPSDLLRNFGMSNLLLETELKAVEETYGVSLRKKALDPSRHDTVYYPQFNEMIRKEAGEMAEYYEIFYCLEKSIRDLINSKLEDAFGTDWWETKVPQPVKDNAKKNRTREIQEGVTERSQDMLDYTTFGELGEIIRHNWAEFSDVLNDQQAVTRVMSRLNLLRGPIAHCSPLQDDEKMRLELTLKDWFRLME